MIGKRCLLFVVFAAAVFATVARAERRVALVIGIRVPACLIVAQYHQMTPMPSLLFARLASRLVSLAQRARGPRVQARGPRFLIRRKAADIAVVYYAGTASR